jgi:hypothetical protein
MKLSKQAKWGFGLLAGIIIWALLFIYVISPLVNMNSN